MQIAYFTFRTNKHIAVFKEQDVPLFVFGSLKQDFERFQEILLLNKVERIIGVANVSDDTRLEKIAVNRFNDYRIDKTAQESYRLFLPPEAQFSISDSFTTSFCNWVTYKTAQWLYDTNNAATLSFLHYNSKDLETVVKYCKDDFKRA